MRETFHFFISNHFATMYLFGNNSTNACKFVNPIIMNKQLQNFCKIFPVTLEMEAHDSYHPIYLYENIITSVLGHKRIITD